MYDLALLIFTLLIIASVIVGYQLFQQVSEEFVKNYKRLLVWWLIFGLCLLVLYLGLEAIALLVVALIIWSTYELFNILKVPLTIYNSVSASLFVGLILYCIFTRPEQAQIIFVLSLMVAFGSYSLSLSSKIFVSAHWLTCCFALSSILLIAVLADMSKLDYAHLLLFIFFATAANDIAQYVFGRLFGKTVIAPQVSPNKTFEGLLGGLVITSVVCVFSLPNILTISRGWSLCIGIILSLAGLLGDLNISKLKRAQNLKDSGTSIPGHGGVLDRIDSLLMIVPVYGLIMAVFYT